MSFSRPLATRCVTSNNVACIIKSSLIDLNPIELNYPFMISLGKCNGGCNVAGEISTKIYFKSETKDVNVKLFNIIRRINEFKTFKPI